MYEYLTAVYCNALLALRRICRSQQTCDIIEFNHRARRERRKVAA